MRAAFRNALPDVDVRAGTAENIPVGDSSVDALLCAQAWHWVNPSIAGPEVARVLRPGGIFGLVWNVRDRRHAWVDALARLLGPSGTIEPGETPDVGGAFGDLEHAEFTFVHTLPRNLVFDLVASRSQVVDLATSERSELLRSVEALVDAETETQGRTHITIPYRTLCFRAQKP